MPSENPVFRRHGFISNHRLRMAGYRLLSEAEEILEALISRCTQLVEMRSAEKNRLQQVHETQIQSVEALIAHFDTLIAALDQQIEEHNDTYFGDKSSLLQSIKGVGPTTAVTYVLHIVPVPPAGWG